VSVSERKRNQVRRKSSSKPKCSFQIQQRFSIHSESQSKCPKPRRKQSSTSKRSQPKSPRAKDVKLEQLLSGYAPPTAGYGRHDVRANDRVTVELDAKMDLVIEQVAKAKAMKDSLLRSNRDLKADLDLLQGHVEADRARAVREKESIYKVKQLVMVREQENAELRKAVTAVRMQMLRLMGDHNKELKKFKGKSQLESDKHKHNNYTKELFHGITLEL